MRRLTETSLTNAAIHYLGRYSASRQGLTDMLLRKAKRHGLRTQTPAPDDLRSTIERVVAKMVSLGYVDDVRFARNKVDSLRRRGKSTNAIVLALKKKRVSAEVIGETATRDNQAELEAAVRLVTKKKLGRDAARRSRDLIVVLRAGFSFDLAKKALAAVRDSGGLRDSTE
jgi:regulatory protein